MPFIFQILAYTERIAEKVKYGILINDKVSTKL